VLKRRVERPAPERDRSLPGTSLQVGAREVREHDALFAWVMTTPEFTGAAFVVARAHVAHVDAKGCRPRRSSRT
jgi:hypothetical protein